MPIPSHALSVDFPELKEQIQEMEATSPVFKALSDEYHDLDREIRSLEANDVPTSDQHFSSMKLRRAYLKDKALDMLR